MTLVGDIGGTNTTLAVVERSGEIFSIVARERFDTHRLNDVEEAIERFRSRVGSLWGDVSACCLSGAGPVTDRVCTMTNVNFLIDASAIEEHTGLRTFVINDFSAICYALPLLDTHTQIQAVPIAHPNGSTPLSHGTVRAVVGAGTGLGTGYLIQDGEHYTAHASEGGHTDFPANDELSRAFVAHLEARYGTPPDSETYVSGQGIANAFRFFHETGRIERDEVVSRIAALDARDIPGAVSAGASSHEGLAQIMRFFVTLYAQYARNTALFFLPLGGLYLAGGIAAKNESWFTADHLFMRTFEQNFNERVRPLLRETPVFLIKDYDISLYGSAHAAHSFIQGGV